MGERSSPPSRGEGAWRCEGSRVASSPRICQGIDESASIFVHELTSAEAQSTGAPVTQSRRLVEVSTSAGLEHAQVLLSWRVLVTTESHVRTVITDFSRHGLSPSHFISTERECCLSGVRLLGLRAAVRFLAASRAGTHDLRGWRPEVFLEPQVGKPWPNLGAKIAAEL